MPLLDNYDLFCQHEEEQERWLQSLPKCYECGDPIQDEKCFEINGELICPKCLKKNHEKWTDDYYE